MQRRILGDEELRARDRTAMASGRGQIWILGLLPRYHTTIAYWCLRATGNAETAARLAREILEDVHRQLPSYPDGTSFAAWLFKIVAKHATPEMQRRILKGDRT